MSYNSFPEWTECVRLEQTGIVQGWICPECGGDVTKFAFDALFGDNGVLQHCASHPAHIPPRLLFTCLYCDQELSTPLFAIVQVGRIRVERD
jgi:hypothetical protein